MFDFKTLRKQVIQDADMAFRQRLASNPVPAQDEIYIGAFVEELESQVKNVVLNMYKKGYSVESSGFYGHEGEFQAIDGYFTIDNKTREHLYRMGVLVCKGIHVGLLGYSKYWTQIRFYPHKADLKLIKKKWDEIIEILPDLGYYAEPSTSGAAQDFREKYCPKNKEVRLSFLKHILKVGNICASYRKRFQRELKKISKD